MGIIKDVLYKVSDLKYLEKVKVQTVFPYYHIVSNSKKAHIKHLYKYKDISCFKSDINLLCSHYSPLSVKHMLDKRIIAKNSFLLSFDDGLSEAYTTIYPILKEKKLSAIFFINPNFIDNKEMMFKHRLSLLYSYLEKSDFDKHLLNKTAKIANFSYENKSSFREAFFKLKFIKDKELSLIFKLLNIDEKQYLADNKPYLTRDQIQKMLEAGFCFGGHSMSHAPFDQLSFEEQKKEAIDSIEWLKKNFGITYSLFAFPFSDKGISRKLIEELFSYDPNIILFGNSGLKKDMDSRIIQRFSIENPNKEITKVLVSENLYKYYNKLIGKYKIKRK